MFKSTQPTFNMDTGHTDASAWIANTNPTLKEMESNMYDVNDLANRTMAAGFTRIGLYFEAYLNTVQKAYLTLYKEQLHRTLTQAELDKHPEWGF